MILAAALDLLGRTFLRAGRPRAARAAATESVTRFRRLITAGRLDLTPDLDRAEVGLEVCRSYLVGLRRSG